MRGEAGNALTLLKRKIRKKADFSCRGGGEKKQTQVQYSTSDTKSIIRT